MLVTLNEVMRIAEEKKIAVGSFNAPNLEALQAIMEAAEEVNLPVILQFAQCHEDWIPLSLIGPIMVEAAKKASVPVCVHLDHGETLEYLQQALDMGFTGIMYDGSVLPYEENLKNTCAAVQMAAKTGASVEAELGSMGRRESGAGDGSGADDETKIYTETGNIPVVMHGGSGVSREDYHKAIEAGVRKINYFTYMDKAGGAAAAEVIDGRKEGEPLFFSTISMAARKAMKENVLAAMRMFAGE